MRHALYKINIFVNNILKYHFYYDNRDCRFPIYVNNPVTSCTGNDITVRYRIDENKLYYKKDAIRKPGTLGWTFLSRGAILRWSAVQCTTGQCFISWKKGLVLVTEEQSGHVSVPRLFWGPFDGFDVGGYAIYWSVNDTSAGSFSLLASVDDTTYEYTHQGVQIGTNDTAYYKVRAYNQGEGLYSPYTHLVWTTISGRFFKGFFSGDSPVDAEKSGRILVFPNPFNSIAVFEVQVSQAGFYRLEILDVFGKPVATLHRGFLSAGEHRFQFSGASLPTGVYFYRLAGNTRFAVFTGKLLLIR